MGDIIKIFESLGAKLSQLGATESGREIISLAIAQNPWFTEQDINRAVRAICLEMLDGHKLQQWLSKYKSVATPQRVAIIMAGNIPLVGFFDLMCVLCSGHEAHIKPSSKDKVLMHYVVDLLREIEPQIPIFNYNATESYDMVIATGGDDANRFFESHFANTRHLLRGSRHSVAVLDGTETLEELNLLLEDITAYSGLGCRSVSMIFAPESYEIRFPQSEALNPKLRRNVASMRALYTMQGKSHHDAGAFIVTEEKEFPSSLALVSLQRYSDIADVKEWLATNCDNIQCVVSHCQIEGCVGFGEAQYPTLWNYADNIDTMLFLGQERCDV